MERASIHMGPFIPPQNSSVAWEGLAVSATFRAGRLAALCGVSLRTLQRHFNELYGTSVTRWLREVRLNKARQLLASAASVKVVAYTLNYKQPAHFTRDFKLRFGVCPQTLLAPRLLRQLGAPDGLFDERQN